jgi:hypothetical protein
VVLREGLKNVLLTLDDLLSLLLKLLLLESGNDLVGMESFGLNGFGSLLGDVKLEGVMGLDCGFVVRQELEVI